MMSLALAALALLSAPVRAQLTSEPAWTRFRGAQRTELRHALADRFNRLVFREYRNLAVFAGAPHSGREAFLEDFLLHFPKTAVFSGHAALTDWTTLTASLAPRELNLIVLDERTAPAAADLRPLLTQVDRWNQAGLVVKVVFNVATPDAVLPDTLIYGGDFFDFTPEYAASLRRTFDAFAPRHKRSEVWRRLITEVKGRRKLAIGNLSDVISSTEKHVLVLAGTEESNAGLVDEVYRRLNSASPLEYGGEAREVVPVEPRRRFDLNLVKVRTWASLVGQWPPAEGIAQLVDHLVTLNDGGTFAKAVIEVTEPTQLLERTRARTQVVATHQGCERLLSWRASGV